MKELLEKFKDQILKEINVKLQNKRSLNTKFRVGTYYPMTYLYFFLNYGTINEFKWLLISGADPNILPVERNNRTLLTYAVQLKTKEESFQKTKLLLEYGAKVNYGGKRESSPILFSQHNEVTKLLITFGADVNIGGKYNKLYSAIKGNNIQLAKLLIENGAEVNLFTHLETAVIKGNVEILKLLIENGAELVEPFELFKLAIKRDELDIIQLLLDNGLSPTTSIEYLITNSNSSSIKLQTNIINQLLSNLRKEDIKEIVKTFLFHSNQIHIIQLFLNYGVDINIRGENNDTPLIRAIKKEYYHLVEFYIASGANKYLQDDEGNTILHILLKRLANKKNRTKEALSIVQKLLETWNDFTIVNNEEKSILSLIKVVKVPEIIKTLVGLGFYYESYLKVAISTEKYELIKLFIKRELIPSSQKDYVKKILEKFLENGDLEDIKLLVEKGFDYKDYCLDILIISLEKEDINFTKQMLLKNYNLLNIHSDRIIRYFLQNRDLNFINFLIKNNYRPYKSLFDVLSLASYENNLETIKDIFKDNKEMAQRVLNDLKDSEGNTLGHLACFFNSYETLIYFLKYGLDTTQRNKSGLTIFETIISENNFDLIKIRRILDFVDINQPDMKGFTPLMRSCSICEISLILLLIQSGADINAESRDGSTSLGNAFKRNEINLIKLLLNFGANPNVYFDKYRKVTLLMQSVVAGRRHLTIMLIEAGADINVSDTEGNSALHLAYKINDLKMVEYLLEKGADPNKMNNLNQIPKFTNKSYR